MTKWGTKETWNEEEMVIRAPRERVQGAAMVW
jgi:hypothetical protein